MDLAGNDGRVAFVRLPDGPGGGAAARRAGRGFVRREPEPAADGGLSVFLRPDGDHEGAAFARKAGPAAAAEISENFVHFS